MKKLILVICLLIGMTACTPSADETLPTRVVLPTDASAESATEAVIDPLETATEAVIDPLETATEAVIDPLETATEAVIDPLETATEAVIDPLEIVTEAVIDPIAVATEAIVVTPQESVTEFVIDPLPLEAVTESVIDPLGNNPTPIIIPASQTQPPTATPSNGLTVIMPTIDLANLPTSVPTATPYPVVANFANLTESLQIVRLTGTVEIFIDRVRDDDIFLVKDANGVAVELLWDITTIDYIPANGQVIEAIGTVAISKYGNSPFVMTTISIVPLSVVDETDN